MSGATATTLLVIVVLPGAMAVAFVIRHLLHLRIGLWRTVLAVAIGLLVAQRLGAALPHDDQYGPLITIQVGGGLLAATVSLLFVQMMLPDGLWVLSMKAVRVLRRRWKRGRRLSELGALAFRRGVLPYLTQRFQSGGRLSSSQAMLARSLRLAIEEGGVTFIKLGQVPSIRHGLLPAEFVAELDRLTDQVTPAPWAQVEELLTTVWQQPLENIFPAFDREPIAAASIAQVYRATLPCGTPVAVKVQRPGVRQRVERDLDLLCGLAASARPSHDGAWAGQAFGLRELADGFAASLREELDFRVEARNMATVAGFERQDRRTVPMRIPTVFPHLSNDQVLVMEYLEGTPLSRAEETKYDSSRPTRSALARSLLSRVLRQILVEGIFHADPHPGNIYLLSSGELALIDFGCVGRLDASCRTALVRLLLALRNNDPAGAADALIAAVDAPVETDGRRLERDLSQFMTQHLQASGDNDYGVFVELFRLIARHRLQAPPQLAAVFRSLATLKGTLALLDPELDMMGASRRLGYLHLLDQLKPNRVIPALAGEALSLVPMLRALPGRMDRIVRSVEQGGIYARVRILADEQDRSFISNLVGLCLLTFLSAAVGLMAVLLLRVEGGPQVTAGVNLPQIFGYNFLLVSSLLMLRSLVLIMRRVV